MLSGAYLSTQSVHVSLLVRKLELIAVASFYKEVDKKLTIPQNVRHSFTDLGAFILRMVSHLSRIAV